MTDLDHALLRKLAEWSPDDVAVTSLYLDVDGRRYPRRADYEVRLEELLRSVRAQAADGSPAAVRSVEGDVDAISAFVRGRFERGDTRGLALFSSSGAGLWEEIELPRPVRDRALVGPRAELRMLEAMLETYGATCVAVVDFEKARIFLLHLGRIEEVQDLWDEVPGRHEQGGRSQMRIQRHVDDHRMQHVKHVAEALFRLWKERGFERLVLAGPGEAHRDLEPELHGYLRRLVCAHVGLPMTATIEDVRSHTLRIEEEVGRAAERDVVERLTAAAPTGGGVLGLTPTLGALSEGRVGTLVVRLDLERPGVRCDTCGRLAEHGAACPVCGSPTRSIPDVVELAVATALETGCRVETVTADEGLVDLGGIGALLRF